MRVLNSFIQKALNGKIALLDDGNARRTYCYVSDAVEILWNVLLSGKDPIYNVGGNSRTTIRSLAEKIGSYLHVPIEIPQRSRTFTDAPEDVFLDMSKVKNEFEKTDYISFDKGLAKTIEWQKILYQSIK